MANTAGLCTRHAEVMIGHHKLDLERSAKSRSVRHDLTPRIEVR